MDPNTVLTGGRTSTVNYSVKDNGEYDLNSTLDTIIDPVVPAISSGGSGFGCVRNSEADFTIELQACCHWPVLQSE